MTPSEPLPTMLTPTTDAAFECLHPNARWLQRLESIFAALMVLGGLGIATSLLVFRDVILDSGLLWLLPLLLVLALPVGWVFGGLRHARTRFRLDASGLEIHRGVLWRSQSRIPRSRVQHTDIHSGPLDRRLGLAMLRVFTAGTRMASVDLGGLPTARAVELRDALLDDHDDSL